MSGYAYEWAGMWGGGEKRTLIIIITIIIIIIVVVVIITTTVVLLECYILNFYARYLPIRDGAVSRETIIPSC